MAIVKKPGMSIVHVEFGKITEMEFGLHMDVLQRENYDKNY